MSESKATDEAITAEEDNLQVQVGVYAHACVWGGVVHLCMFLLVCAGFLSIFLFGPVCLFVMSLTNYSRSFAAALQSIRARRRR